MSELWRRLLCFFRRGRLERDLEEEMRFHTDRKAEAYRDAGMSAEEARYAARRRFGNELLMREAAREAWSWRWLDGLARDVRYGLRALGHSPGFTAVAVLTLALGLGANTAIFAVLYNVALRPLPYPGADRLVKVYLTADMDRRGPRDIAFSYPKFQDLKRANTVFDSMAAYALRSYTIMAPGPAELVRGEIASASYFSMTGFAPAMGRAFLPEEDGERGAQTVVILGDGLWRSRFGADPAVIGKELRIDGRTFYVVGVAPPGARGDSGRAEFWLPLSTASAGDLTSRHQHWLQAIARLKPGVTMTQATTEVRAIMRRLEDQQPSRPGIWDANAVSLAESKINPALSKGLVALYAAAGFVLLIACANLANLTMARMVGRQREIAVRVAIGAGRGSLIRQVLVENVLLSIGGGAAGALLAAWSMKLMALLRPDADLGAWPAYMWQLDAHAMRLTVPALAFSVTLSFAAGILFGLAPALRVSRGDINDALRGGVLRGSQPRRAAGFRSVLLAGQMALVVVLLVSAGVMIRTFVRLMETPLGVQTKNVLTFQIGLPYEKYKGAAGRQFFDRLMTQVSGLPGVQAVTISQDLPGLQRNMVTSVNGLDSRPVEQEYIGGRWVDPGFFELLRIPILSGRAFVEQDRQGPPVAILSERAARALFPGQDPIGHSIKAMGTKREIVGVAAEVHYEQQRQPLAIVGDMYAAPAQTGGGYVILRAARNPIALLPAVRKIVADLDPEIPVQGARTMEDNMALVHSYERFSTVLLGAFAALALGLAAVGIYGVFSHAVAARTREFGIRLATGARGGDILRLVLRESALLCIAGLAVGLPAALAAARALGSMISGAAAEDPWTYATAAAVLAGVALAASYIPARRAARVDPLQALRCE
jgi:putative ABC transport system permease protein